MRGVCSARTEIVERIKVDMQRWDDFMAQARPMLDAMPEEKREAFAECGWNLEDAGCEAAETVLHDGAV